MLTFPSNRFLLAFAGTSYTAIVIVDLIGVSMGRVLIPSTLHEAGLALIVTAAVTGGVGTKVDAFWDVARRIEQLRKHEANVLPLLRHNHRRRRSD